MTTKRECLIEALRAVKPEMLKTLEHLREEGSRLRNRPDVVWHMLLQSFSGMGNNRGYYGLIKNHDNYRKVAWTTLTGLSEGELRRALLSGLSSGSVRMYKKKTEWLIADYKMILNMGGIDAAREKMNSLAGCDAKIKFFQSFQGISDKYGRNIWMDFCDRDFAETIAIDVRLKKIFDELNIDMSRYAIAERNMLDIAHDAGLTGWEMDRLLFNYTDHFLKSMSGGSAGNMDHGVGHAMESKRPKNQLPAQNTDQGIGLNDRFLSIYRGFLSTYKNTTSLGGKLRHLEALFNSFGGYAIPLSAVVDDVERVNLCRLLFDSNNTLNYITYPVCMAYQLGYIVLTDSSLKKSESSPW